MPLNLPVCLSWSSSRLLLVLPIRLTAKQLVLCCFCVSMAAPVPVCMPRCLRLFPGLRACGRAFCQACCNVHMALRKYGVDLRSVWIGRRPNVNSVDPRTSERVAATEIPPLPPPLPPPPSPTPPSLTTLPSDPLPQPSGHSPRPSAAGASSERDERKLSVGHTTC